jgi:cytoskeletal protein RodZ
VSGSIRSSRGIMLRRLFRALLCSVIIIGNIHAQEVIVAREKKPQPATQPPEPPKQTVQPSEELPPETPAPPRKSKPREKKSTSRTLTLEKMRAAGARAAEGPNERSASEPTKTREADVESALARNPIVAETPRPVKRQTPVAQESSSRSTKQRGTPLEGIGPIRPTMLESGREPPSPSPSGR